VDRQIRTYREQGFCRWKLLEKPGGEFIGFCGVGYWREGMEPEIGWWLARHRWGCGLATEAAQAALRDIFERVKLDRVVSIAMVGNAASTHIMQKLGLRFECEFENEGVRLVKYAIARTEYSERQLLP
jgi:RimJ/RimL family protein N-acetyltransferase